jgi:hypothetical protein
MCFTVSPSGKAMSGPIVTKSSHSLVVDAGRYLPFEPRPRTSNVFAPSSGRDWASLPFAPVTSFTHASPVRCRSTRTSRTRFELGDEPTDGGVRYRYESADPDAAFAHWERQRTLALIPMTKLTATDCAPVWWAVANANLNLTDRPAPTEPFALRLLLHTPGPKLAPDRMKRIIDGVVCALQAEEDPVAAQAGAPRVAAQLGESEGVIAAALLDRRRAALGLVKGLRRPSAWNPSDNRCVAADIRLRPGDAWTVQGNVVTVLPT